MTRYVFPPDSKGFDDVVKMVMSNMTSSSGGMSGMSNSTSSSGGMSGMSNSTSSSGGMSGMSNMTSSSMMGDGMMGMSNLTVPNVPSGYVVPAMSSMSSTEKMNFMSCWDDVKDPHQCQISMVWNWQTIDSCFLAHTWHVTSRGMFAGSCIGLFFWMLAFAWFKRVCQEYVKTTTAIHWTNKDTNCDSTCCNPEGETVDDTAPDTGFFKQPVLAKYLNPLVEVFKHQWLIHRNPKDSLGNNQVYPTFAEHFIKTLLFIVEWINSYLIMMMWMYFNGYIIITSILGYIFGELIFHYHPITFYDGCKKCETKK